MPNPDIVRILDSYAGILYDGGTAIYRAVTSYEPPAHRDEIDRNFQNGVPSELNSLWTTTRRAKLYFSQGSCGMTILSPRESRAETDRLRELGEIDDRFYHGRDIVVGLFETEPDRLFYNPERDALRLATPIDDRENWLIVGHNVVEFLENYRYHALAGGWQYAFRAGPQLFHKRCTARGIHPGEGLTPGASLDIRS